MSEPTILTQTRVLRDKDGRANYRRRYIWRGPADQDVFVFQNVRDLEWERIDVVCETPCASVVAIERTRDVGGTIPSTNNAFRRWRIYGNGLAQRGFWCRDTIDANNEHMEFHANTVYGVSRPFVFAGIQSKLHRLTHNVIETFDVAVTSDTGFHYAGGTMAVGSLAFDLTRAGDPVSVRDCGIETVGRLLRTSGPRTDAQPIVLDSVRYAADQLAADGAMIVMRHAGPLVIVGGSYGDGAQPIPHIKLAGIGEQAVHIAGAKFGAYGANAAPVIRANPGVRPTLTGGVCTFQRDDANPERTQVQVVGTA